MKNAWHNSLCQNLETHLLPLSNDLSFYEALTYSVLPPGKLFRPKLACALYADLSANADVAGELENNKSALSLLCSALEIHHSYSLVHDDLPCMDDDDYRRGKLSTHKKYGQWQAVLAGDALLHHSHYLMGKVNKGNHYQLRQFFNWALGGKGLILGQVFDLGGIINESFPSLLRTHELKTGRLIQLSILCGAWCAKEELSYHEIKKYMRIGSSLGICFQLLDDLSEATEALSEHEKDVNPFLEFPKESFLALDKAVTNILDNVQDSKELNELIESYFAKMGSIVEKDINSENSLILKQLDSDTSFDLIAAKLTKKD